MPSVPGFADLQVNSQDKVQLSFGPPEHDGGGAVSAYKVEWDTDPGVMEVQVVETTVNTGPNEVQVVSTSADDVNEQQVVVTAGSLYPEIQTVQTKAAPGETLGGYFTLSYDNTKEGGSIQRSGIISYNAPANVGRDSVLEILRAMNNIGTSGVSDVSKSATADAEGGFTWTITFGHAMGNIQALKLENSNLYGTGADVVLATVQDGNELQGEYTLKFEDFTTKDIQHDASSDEVKNALEALENVGTVQVARGERSDQGGYRWTVTFMTNEGNLPLLVPTSKLSGEGTTVVIEDLVQGNELGGTFQLSHAGNPTNALPFDVSESDLKQELEGLPTITAVHVDRMGPGPQGNYDWTISFTGDAGDVSPFTSDVTSLTETRNDGIDSKAISVTEKHKGTVQEVQQITTSTSDPTAVSTATYFQLQYTANGVSTTTGQIFANPNGDGTCLPQDYEVQQIVTTTVDATSAGGDFEVSNTTSFRLSLSGEQTTDIFANSNDGDCGPGATSIKSALEALSIVKGTVAVSHAPLDPLLNPTKTCTWAITFTNNAGNIDQLQVLTSSVAPSTTITLGDDTITASTVSDGTIGVLQTELEKLSNIGKVQVSATSAAKETCVWQITFLNNAGDLNLLEVSVMGSAYSTASTSGADTVTASSSQEGTSIVLGGQFTLEYFGQRTEYLPYDIDASEMKYALETLSTVGTVDIIRIGPDQNNAYVWTVYFMSNVGDLPSLIVDTQSLSGSLASAHVATSIGGISPRFNSRDPNNGKQATTSFLSV